MSLKNTLSKIVGEENLDTPFKIATGRQLSKQQMEKAKLISSEQSRKICEREAIPFSTLIIIPSSTASFKKTRTKEFLYRTEDGEYTHRVEESELMSTPDASEGWKRIHTGFYPYLTTTSVYDTQGRIKSKKIIQEYGDSHLGTKEVEFCPAGSWFGKKVGSN